ncbi:Threonine/homoserine/homoserine lactone efflux protein [Cohaesibacter marisflavi]|uniref:Threonine/homoserine/homoserine lactone efflux protein n=1 Tax=Cohaesibacter marisflavi TaxID=655353 RepID=A0A1I5D5W0_9HYPH|nr:LysE family translocator [Cohaesibacter marisflavi]SFN94590.1 Threonine/homoserine/homoserine lactone efflux protein [Cohaesibacter marisflavi]
MIQTVMELVVFLFPLAYSPGPGNMFFAANGARFGFRATMPANLGYHIATWLVTAAIGFGFLAAMERVPHLLAYLKVAGSLYVFWIAWTLLRAGVLKGSATPKAAGFGDGALLLILNPKAYVIIALMFTQFLEGDSGEQIGQIMLITTVFTVNNMVAFVLWTLTGDTLGVIFRAPHSSRHLNLVFGSLLAGVALWMLVS